MQIGIDQSYTSTGIVTTVNNSVNNHHLIKTKKIEDSHLEKMIRARTISDQTHKYIIEQITVNNKLPDDCIILIEGLSYGSNGKMAAANRDLAGLQFMIIDKLRETFRDDQIKIIAPTSLKKFATGKGNAKKELLLEALQEQDIEFYNIISRIPKSGGRLDLTDAYWLAMFSE